jgi:sugar lactone lactonase YvrE
MENPQSAARFMERLKILLLILTCAGLTTLGSTIDEDPSVELVLDSKLSLGEGSVWNPAENKLYWVDIEGKAFHIYDPDSKKDIQFPVGHRIGTVVPVKGGGALVALQNGIFKISTTTGKLDSVIRRAGSGWAAWLLIPGRGVHHFTGWTKIRRSIKCWTA